MSKLLKNVNPLGFVDVPLIGREGPAPYYVCDECARRIADPDDNHDPEHEHPDDDHLVDAEHGKPGEGCLVPGEVFEVSDEHAEILLAQVGNYELVTRAVKKAATTDKNEG